ncbi:coiled-coil domain-containing protein 170-like [Dysidea avara]|uniref:coiled-coil domain-containing protein 170-like n=1 Tax=Dysidea avara TaxID=196820 RepID=UPI0033239458
MEGLPAIPRHGVVETSKRHLRTPASLEDSGLDLRETLSTTAASSSVTKVLGETTRSLRGSPHNLTITASSVPFSPRPPSPALKKSGEIVRVTKSELERKEQMINTLRADNLQMQGRLRSLEHIDESYKQLQAVCSELGQIIGCKTEGVAADSMRIILCDKVSKLLSGHSKLTQQLHLCQSDAEKSAGEVAAKNSQCISMESRLSQLSSEVAAKDRQLQQLKNEVDALKQSNARSEAIVTKQRQQISELQVASVEHSASETHNSKLQTELGLAKRQLEKKAAEVNSLCYQLESQRNNVEDVEQRASTAETIYCNLCVQLSAALEMDTTNQDTDNIVSEVVSLTGQCDNLRAKLNEAVHNLEAMQLESKANRETILRLVSEAKKHEKTSVLITELQEAQLEREATLVGIKQEKESLQDHLNVAQDTLHSCKQELSNKEQVITALETSLQRASQAEQSASQQLGDFCSELCAVLGAPLSERASILERGRQLVHRCEESQKRVYGAEEELSTNTSQLQQLEQQYCDACTQLETVQQELHKAKEQNKQLEADTVAADALNSQLKSVTKQHDSFVKKMATAIKLDTNMAQILSGEFMYDALLQRAELLAKQETQVLAEKSSAVYSLQRKLKAARQALESKELHLGLLERKVTALDERIIAYNKEETHRESSVQKVGRLEKQLQKTQQHNEQQKNIIAQLKAQKYDVDQVKAECMAQQEIIERLSTNVEQLTRNKSSISSELTSTVKKLEKAKSKEKDATEKLEADMKSLQQQYDLLAEREKKLSSFRKTIGRLLLEDSQHTEPSDDAITSTLQQLLTSNQAHESRVRSLETSLRQMEHGFKTSYNDTLTLLNYSHES